MYEQYSSQEFEEKYTYSGNLGAFWTPEKTSFRLWAPTADAVSIRLYRSGDPGADDLLAQLRMQPDVCGTWTAERFGNLNGIYYTYPLHAALPCGGRSSLHGSLTLAPPAAKVGINTILQQPL